MVFQDLKTWRKALGLTQDQAAYLFGITRQGYQNRERNPGILIRETHYAALYLADHPEEVAVLLKDFIPTQ